MTRRRLRLFIAAGALFLVFAVLAAFVAVGGHAVPGPDRWVADTLHGFTAKHPSVASAARFVGAVSQPGVLRVIALVWTIGLLVAGKVRAAAWLAGTMTAAGLLGIGAKLLYTRPRPSWPDPITTIGGYSFPSGHALNSAVFAGCVLVLAGQALGPAARNWLRVAALAFVLVVGLDRMLLGVHYLSDVIGGWAFGSALVLVMLGLWPPLSRTHRSRSAAGRAQPRLASPGWGGSRGPDAD